MMQNREISYYALIITEKLFPFFIILFLKIDNIYASQDDSRIAAIELVGTIFSEIRMRYCGGHARNKSF